MIIPGPLEKSIEELNRKISQMEGAAELFQVDVADGILVDGISFTEPTELLKISSNMTLELHLMVSNPLTYLPYAKSKFHHVVSQIEAENVDKFIEVSRQYGFKVGLSIMLETPVTLLEPHLTQIDYVQFMSVAPGAQGRPFEHKVLEKIKQFRLLHPEMELQVDGHMDEETIPLVNLLGVDNYVVGSAIFNDADPVAKYKKLENLLKSI